ncbi:MULTISPECIES: DUF975 family protein [Priestia]|jgi:uncharacterized membrane protein|uniref:DUF975 family protein n=2 Tax=Priestia megaterium TaxID=1404 RepID=A0A6M6DSJ3_PRIMG|nr:MULTISPECIES: DUF975 family protein [Priestia]MCJ7990033.1 DUF975 family protein [Priestia sp. OVS21]ADF40389.1 conserved hypothetical protein [Priestia megaterium DSM 319]KLV32382.1 membrane protein [Priestia megaterium]MBU8754459.1 DUF975 family protein [Priestia megaterium]MBY0197972.1 DUF975 family protein [Priestia megaterium]
MRIKEVKQGALAALKNRWGFAVLLTFVTYLIAAGIPGLIDFLINGFPSGSETEYSQSTLANIVSLLLVPLFFSYYWVLLRLVRGESVRVGNVFDSFSSAGLYFRTLGLYLLTIIYTVLWSILLIIPGIIKSLAYSQAYYVFRDNPDYSVNQSITESRRLMNGYKWTYFLLLLSFIGWGILSIITLGIGLLWLVPYVTTSLGVFYEKLKANETEVAE